MNLCYADDSHYPVGHFGGRNTGVVGSPRPSQL